MHPSSQSCPIEISEELLMQGKIWAFCACDVSAGCNFIYPACDPCTMEPSGRPTLGPLDTVWILVGARWSLTVK